MDSRKQNETCFSAYGCQGKFTLNAKVRFHKFSMKNEELFNKWLVENEV